MERNFFNREFEQFIKSNADQYRMIPSEKVWKGINGSLHTRRKWYAIGFSLLLLLTAVSVTWVMLSYPSSTKQEPATVAQVISQDKKKLPTEPINPRQPVSSRPVASDINTLLSIRKLDAPETSLDPARSPLITSEPANAVSESQADVNNEVRSRNQFLATIIPASPATVAQNKHTTNQPTTIADEKKELMESFNLFSADEKLLINKAIPGSTAKTNKPDPNATYLPLTIESVVNSYKPIRLPKKISWQLYATPTVSYRRLAANKSAKSEGPFADPISYPFTSLTDVNKAVTHKPDMGLELGFAARYPLSKTVKLRAGMQFNINRYDIKAYVYNREQATINLNGADNSVTTWTYYRNYNGFKSDWLKNFYFSVSAPIGAEWRIFGNDKTSLGIAGTVQPTYILRDRAYLISTDYKNYAEVPWLVRRMNVNTSFETFVNFTSRNRTKWQVGPQVRYQVLSSYHNKYPVRENLFDFGMKVGITLNQ